MSHLSLPTNTQSLDLSGTYWVPGPGPTNLWWPCLQCTLPLGFCDTQGPWRYQYTDQAPCSTCPSNIQSLYLSATHRVPESSPPQALDPSVKPVVGLTATWGFPTSKACGSFSLLTLPPGSADCPPCLPHTGVGDLSCLEKQSHLCLKKRKQIGLDQCYSITERRTQCARRM